MAVETIDAVAELCTGVANPTRIAILLGIRHGWQMPTVAEKMGISRSGVQNHIDRLVTFDLVYRPESGDSYALTPLGQFFASWIEDHMEDLAAVVDALPDAEDEAADEVDTIGVELGEETRERLVAEKKWGVIREEMDDELTALGVATAED